MTITDKIVTSEEVDINAELQELGFKGELFPFQERDIKKLRYLKSVLIAAEMGLGKTYEALARDLFIRDRERDFGPGHTLIVAPLSVLPSWRNHIHELLPGAKVRVIDRKNRHLFLQEPAHFYLMHWEALRLMPELRDRTWLHIIADEVHKAKNRKAAQTKALKKLRARARTGLSGTPMINRPDELWSILDWLYKGKFGGYWKFYHKFCKFYVDEYGYKHVTGPRNEHILRNAIDKFFVRHLKEDDDVEIDLPSKYWTEWPVELGPKQRRAYNAMKSDMLTWLGQQEDQPLAAPVVIAKLIRLQQLALSHGEIIMQPQKDDEPKPVFIPSMPSAKIDALLEIIDELDGRPVVVFSQFSKMINLTEQVLEEKGIETVKITGDVSSENREAYIERFQAGEVQVFLATIGAGGIGITLHRASTAVFLDRDWSPAYNQQAEDRLHRIGQTQAVQIIDLIAEDTVDRGRHQRLEMKKEWIRRVLDS